MPPLSRRQLLGLGGLAAGALAGCTSSGPPSPAPTVPTLTPQASRSVPVSVEEWVATRRAPYFIGHRGAGVVVPEHTLPGYLQALDWGAEAIEVSVVRSRDGVLFCHHDLTLDRTTTLTGPVDERSAAELDLALVNVPWLGPAWAGAGMPPVPRLEAVLDAVGGRAVLCIEPKHDAAYDELVATIERRGLASSVMLKLHAPSIRIEQAKQAGFAVFAYLGTTTDTTPAVISDLAGRLDPLRDALVLPARGDAGLIAPELVSHAVATGVPVWLFPVYRRHEVDHFSRLGAQGMVTPRLGYLNGALPPATADAWRAGRLGAGELTRHPYSPVWGLGWPGDGVVALDAPGQTTFLTLGNLSPLAPSFRLQVDVCFEPLPTDIAQHVSIAFGHADDRYYQPGLGHSDGYQALLRADGRLALHLDRAGVPDAEVLTPDVSTLALTTGGWTTLSLAVTPDGITLARDGATVSSPDRRLRGGYLHIGSSAADGRLLLRNLSIT